MAKQGVWQGVGQLLGGPLRNLNPLRREGNYVCLDIGSSALKMLEVRGGDGQVRVINAAVVPLPGHAVQNNMVQEPAAVADAIRGVVEGHDVRARDAITAVPGPAVIIKKVAFPRQSQRTLEHTVLLEASNFIPESLENVNLDYQVVEPAAEGNEMQVLLVAVRKEIINSYTAAIREASLTPVVVDVDYFALENMFELNYTRGAGEVVALVNIGARYSSINILKGGRSAFTGDVSVGGKEFTDALVRALKLSAEEAEVAKQRSQIEGHSQEEVQAALLPAAHFLVEEIHRALSFFWTASVDESINALYLSGGAARLPGLSEMMGQQLGVPVELVNPFQRVSVSHHIEADYLRDNAPALAVSVGLAVRRPGDR